MGPLHGVFLLLHFIGFAALFGGAFVQINPKGQGRVINAAMLHGALTQLVSGVLLVGMLEMGDGTVNHPKIGAKLLALLVIMVLAFANRKKPEISGGVFWGIFSLTLLDAAIAVFV